MDAQIIPVVEQAVLEQMQNKSSFTSLDISNTLKANSFAVKHGDVSVVVRDIYQSGGMDFFGYNRRLIDVVAGRDGLPAKAFLYLHDIAQEKNYTARAQTALPPVRRDQARALQSVTAAAPFLHRPKRHSQNVQRPMSKGRRDGAIAVPVALIVQLGWAAGEPLHLKMQAGTIQVSLLTPGSPARLHLWRDRRVRLCARTLRQAGLAAVDMLWRVEGDSLCVTAADYSP